MDTQKVVVVLLIVAIVLSAINLVVSFSINNFVPAGVPAHGSSVDNAGATVGVIVGEPGGSAS